jgi:hypothetical protein
MGRSESESTTVVNGVVIGVVIGVVTVVGRPAFPDAAFGKTAVVVAPDCEDGAGT